MSLIAYSSAAVAVSVLADVGTVEPGWAGAGLLGLVLAWLLFVHLPAKDKQIQASIDTLRAVFAECQARIDAKSKEFAEREQERDDKFLDALSKLANRTDEMGKAILTMCKFRADQLKYEGRPQ